MNRLLLLLLLAVGCTPARVAAPVPVSAVERTLRAVQAGAAVPADLEVRYSDLHGMHGGTEVTLAGTGAYRWTTLDPRRGTSDQAQGTVTEAQLRDLVALLVELEAWKQVAVRRAPVPDESTAGVDIRVGGEQAAMWEWYNEMGANGRLSRIRNHMVGLRTSVRPAGPAAP